MKGCSRSPSMIRPLKSHYSNVSCNCGFRHFQRPSADWQSAIPPIIRYFPRRYALSGPAGRLRGLRSCSVVLGGPGGAREGERASERQRREWTMPSWRAANPSLARVTICRRRRANAHHRHLDIVTFSLKKFGPRMSPMGSLRGYETDFRRGTFGASIGYGPHRFSQA